MTKRKVYTPSTKVCAGIADEVTMYLPRKLLKSAFIGWPYDPIVTGLDADAAADQAWRGVSCQKSGSQIAEGRR